MSQIQMGRRAFLKGNLLILMGAVSPSLIPTGAWGAPQATELKIGLITDLHYANKPANGSRHYRDTPQKLAEALEAFQKENVNFVVELGDLIDSAPQLDVELGHLKTIQRQLAEGAPNRYFVLGNHCVEHLTKEEFLNEVGQEKSYFSFNQNGYHFVILDSCFRPDGVPYGRHNSKWTEAFVPPDELDWLKQDLAATELPVIVFAHQRLDVDTHYAPRNVADVRSVLESSGKVRAVFQGHSHANDYKDINGIHYCTLVAMIEGNGPENNGYSILSVSQSGNLELTGFRKQKNREFPVARR